MDTVVALFQENPLAAAFGAMGLICQLAWPLFRTHRTIVGVQFGIGADYGTQYALIGAWSGAGVAALGAAQSAFAFFFEQHPWLSRAGLIFLPIAATICVATWSGPASFCALIAVSLIMIGRLQRDTLRLRILHLAAAPFGVGYDILVGALPALIGGSLAGIMAATMLVREIKSRRQTSSRS